MEWLICLLILFVLVKVIFDLVVNSKRKKLLLLWASLFIISLGMVVLLIFITLKVTENDTQYEVLLVAATTMFATIVVLFFYVWLIKCSTFTCEECGKKYKFGWIWSKKSRIFWTRRFAKFRCPNCKNWCKPKFTYFDDKDELNNCENANKRESSN